MFYNRSWQGVCIEQFINELDSYLVWYNDYAFYQFATQKETTTM
jgi:hypothetical protein